MPHALADRIASWRRLPDAEQRRRLRLLVVDEVVGNMRMEGQPVSAEWQSRARNNATLR